MQHYRPNLSYPDSEKPKLTKLETLYGAWNQHFTDNNSELAKHEDDADGMVFDGFYPHYFASSKRRVLFIGRETVDMRSSNYIEALHRVYHSEPKRIRKRNLDSHKFTYRLLCIAYGIVNGMPEWKDIPEASEIGDTVGEATGLSFAYMNISKMSNQSGKSTPANWPLINAAFALSIQGPHGRNFIREEIAILDPHIIVTMNLPDAMVDSLAEGGCEFRHESKRAKSFCLNINGQDRQLIDIWHFSAPRAAGHRLDDNEDFYTPICDTIRRNEASS